MYILYIIYIIIIYILYILNKNYTYNYMYFNKKILEIRENSIY